MRVVGSRHSFTGIGDSGELIALAGLPADVTVDRAAGTATVPTALTYAQVALALEPHGVALHSLASLRHISVGGSIATATHGSGDANDNLDPNLVRRTRSPGTRLAARTSTPSAVSSLG